MLIRIFLYLLPVLFFGFFAGLWHREVELGKESLTWPTVQARVSEASYGSKSDRLVYFYTVDGKEYKGRKLEYCPMRDADLREYFERHIEGKKEIEVFYKPTAPSWSVARPGMDGRQFFGYAILGGAALFGVFAMDRLHRRFFRKVSAAE